MRIEHIKIKSGGCWYVHCVYYTGESEWRYAATRELARIEAKSHTSMQKGNSAVCFSAKDVFRYR